MALVNGLCGLSHIITIIIHIHLENECIVQLPHVQVKGCWWESNPSSGIPNKILHFQTTTVFVAYSTKYAFHTVKLSWRPGG